MPRRPNPNPFNEQEQPCIFFRVGLHYPEHFLILREDALDTAQRVQRVWPTKPVPSGLIADFGPEIFECAARIASLPHGVRSLVFKAGENVLVTEIADAGFLSRASSEAIQKIRNLSQINSNIPKLSTAIQTFSDINFFRYASGSLGRTEIIRDMITVGYFLIHSRFRGQGIEDEDLFMYNNRARSFQTALFDKFPRLQDKEVIAHVPESELAKIIGRATLTMEMLRLNKVVVNGNGHKDGHKNGGKNGNGKPHPEPTRSVDLKQLTRLTNATVPRARRGLTPF